MSFLSSRVYKDAIAASRQAQCLARVSTSLSDAVVLAHGELSIRSFDTRHGICFISGAASSSEFSGSWPLVMPALRRLLPNASVAEAKWQALQSACSDPLGPGAAAAAVAFLPVMSAAQLESLNIVRGAVYDCELPDPSPTLSVIELLSSRLAEVRATLPETFPFANMCNSSGAANATLAVADLKAEFQVAVARSNVNLLATQLIQTLDHSPAGSLAGSSGAVAHTRTIIHFIGLLGSGRGALLGYALRIAAGVPTDARRLKGMTAVAVGDSLLLQYRLTEYIASAPAAWTSLFLARASQLLIETRALQVALVMPMTPADFSAALNISAAEYGSTLVRDLLLLTAELEALQAGLLARVASRQSEARISLTASILGALLALVALTGSPRAWRAISETSRLRAIEGEALRRRQLTRTLMHEVRQPLSSLLVGMELLKGITVSVLSRQGSLAMQAWDGADGDAAAPESSVDASVPRNTVTSFAASDAADGISFAVKCSAPAQTSYVAAVKLVAQTAELPAPVSGVAMGNTSLPLATSPGRSCAAEAADIIEVMLGAILRLSRLTTDSLDLERMESATLPLAPVPASLLSEVAQAVREASFGAQPKRVRLLLDAQCEKAVLAHLGVRAADAASPAPSLGVVTSHSELAPLPDDMSLLVDPDRLRQVLLNLLTNAVRHALQDSQVRVAVRVRLGKAAPPGDTGQRRASCIPQLCCCSVGKSSHRQVRIVPAELPSSQSVGSGDAMLSVHSGCDGCDACPDANNVHPHAHAEAQGVTGLAVPPASQTCAHSSDSELQVGRLPIAVTISVTDSGAGIPSNKQASLFQPFSQLHGSSRDGQGTAGSGLGLAVSRSLVQLMGGDITVASTPASGTTFTVQFATVAHARFNVIYGRTRGVEPLALRSLADGPSASKCAAVNGGIGDPESAPSASPAATAAAQTTPAAAPQAAAVMATTSMVTSGSRESPLPASPFLLPLQPRNSFPAAISVGSSSPTRPSAPASPADSFSLPSPSRLPSASLSAHAPTSSSSSSMLLSSPLVGLGLRILVVDDTDSNLRLLVKLVRSLGADIVDGVGDGAAAVDRVRSTAADGPAYHAILLDRHMPIMDGETCARTLRGPGIGYRGVILAVSADADQSFLDAGADALVQKPVSRAALAAALCQRLNV